MKLNCGCGNDLKPFGEDGWTNLDFRQIEGVDIVCDMLEGIPLENDSVEQLLAKDVLEHFPLDKTDQILQEWHRIMKQGASIRIEVPNLESQFKQWIMGTLPTLYEGQDETERFSQIVYGKQDYEGNFHYQMFDKIRLEKVLYKNGFEITKNYYRGRALGVIAWKV